MEELELEAIAHYGDKLNDAGGDLSELSKEERSHLQLLMHKYEIERRLEKWVAKLSQGQLL